MLRIPEKFCAGATGKLFMNYGGEPFNAFKAEVDAALLKLKGSPLGERLLKDIEASTKDVSIYRFPKNTCALAVENDADDACYAEVLKDDTLHALMDSLANDAQSASSAEFKHACRKLRVEIICGVGVGAKATVPKFASDALGRGKAGYWLTHKLTPGKGAEAIVRWNPDEKNAWPQNLPDPPPWSTRPTWISLVHELIHAWRLVSGRVVFHPTTPEYYEEAMTVGLAPYDRGEFTENAFRMLGDVPRRSFYGPDTKGQTDKAAAKKYG